MKTHGPHFIELTVYMTGKKILINLDHLGDITSLNDGTSSVTYWRSDVEDYDIKVAESYEDIKAMLREYGFLVEKEEKDD